MKEFTMADNKNEITRSILDKLCGIYSYFGDPHDIKKLLTEELNEIFNEISSNLLIPVKNRLLFYQKL